jgi:hypothetical protein
MTIAKIRKSQLSKSHELRQLVVVLSLLIICIVLLQVYPLGKRVS